MHERTQSLARLAFLGMIASVLAGCGGTASGPPVDTAKIIDTIKSDEVRWNADYKSGDPAKVAAHYAADAVVMSPGAQEAVGRAAITTAAARTFNDPQYALTFASDHVDVASSGDIAVARGAYRETTTDPKSGAATTAGGSYVTVYKPGPDGAWKAVWDINTPNGQSTPAPPASGP